MPLQPLPSLGRFRRKRAPERHFLVPLLKSTVADRADAVQADSSCHPNGQYHDGPYQATAGAQGRSALGSPDLTADLASGMIGPGRHRMFWPR